MRIVKGLIEDLVKLKIKKLTGNKKFRRFLGVLNHYQIILLIELKIWRKVLERIFI